MLGAVRIARCSKTATEGSLISAEGSFISAEGSLISIVLLLLLYPFIASADQFVAWSGYEIHYAVFSSLIIPDDVAQAHGITRAKGRIIANISIKQGNDSVAATVTGTARNLLGQVLPLTFSEVRETDAIYYLANQVINEKDTIHFSISVRPVNMSEAYELKFMRQYFSFKDQ